MNKIHDLKTIPPFYKDVENGLKTFEVRKNDRDFKVGDCLVLQEYLPKTETFTGEMILMRVTYIALDLPWANDGYAVMSIEPWQE